MPRACGLVPPPVGSRRRVTRTHGGPGPGGRAQEPAPGWRSLRAGMRARDGSVPRRAGQETAVRTTVSGPCRRNGPGPRKRGVHEHGSAPRLPSPASRSTAPPGDPAPPRGAAEHGPRTAAPRTRAGHERDAPTGHRCRTAGAAACRWRAGAGIRLGPGPGSRFGVPGPCRLGVGFRDVVRRGGTAASWARACAGPGLRGGSRFGVFGPCRLRVGYRDVVRRGGTAASRARARAGPGLRGRFRRRFPSGVRVPSGVRGPTGCRCRIAYVGRCPGCTRPGGRAGPGCLLPGGGAAAPGDPSPSRCSSPPGAGAGGGARRGHGAGRGASAYR